MKKRILLITLIGMSIGINAQNTFPSNGSVGIGTSTPSIWFNSHVVEIQNNRPVLKLNSKGTTGTLVFTNALVSSNHYGEFHLNHSYSSSDPSKSRFRFGSYPGGDILTLQADGNVGIGTSTPAEKLQVNEGNIRVFGYNTSRYIRFTEANLQGAFINYDGTKNILNIGVHDINSTDLTNDYNSISIVRGNGNVGIGTIDTKGFKLGVNGKIAAEEVKVAIYNNWSDFVFLDDYKLPTLQEVEKHINEKGHLKDIPSAEEVEKNGIYLGEMNAKLLQKIEELTLYTIQQQKEIESFKKQNYRIDKLKKENKSLKTMNSKLIELQKRLEKLEKK
jgi:hypothetical protein